MSIGSVPGAPATVPVLLHEAAQERHVEAGRGVDAAADVGDRDDPRAGLVQEAGGRLADVAEALDGDGGAGQIEADPAGGVLDRVDDALAGRVDATVGAADRDGLAGDDAGHRVAAVHRDRVHDPGHRLGVGAHVRAPGCRSRAR